MIKDFIVNRQPVLVAGLVTWLTPALASYGLHLDAQGVVFVTSLVGFIVSWLARSVVWSQHTLDKQS